MALVYFYFTDRNWRLVCLSDVCAADSSTPSSNGGRNYLQKKRRKMAGIMECKKRSELSLVSIGIPTYNRPDGLRNTLSCITKQPYKNLEVIVSDNCSNDSETQSLVEEYMNDYPYIQYHRQEKISGDWQLQICFEKGFR